MWRLFASSVVIFTFVASNTDFMFPDDDVSTDSVPMVTERIGTEPEECPRNMFRYTGEGAPDGGICDCNAAYLYYQPNDTCYAAYRQGPCPPRNYFVLKPGKAEVPKCESNPCLKDGLVSYNNTCSKVESLVGPCGANNYLIVNSTFQLECVEILIAVQHIIDVPANRCPSGSRRNALGQCRKML